MSDETQPKLCVECKWHSDEGSVPSHPAKLHACSNEYCGARKSVVDGKQLYARCEAERSSVGSCGPDGKYWEVAKTSRRID